MATDTTRRSDLFSHEDLWAEIEAIAREARHVRLAEDRLEILAQWLASSAPEVPVPFWRDPTGHPGAMPDVNDAATIQFVLVSMSCCFCIWRPTAGGVEAWPCTVGGRDLWGAEALAACHRRAIEEGVDLLDSAVLRALEASDVARIFRDERTGATTLQLLEERAQKYREIGSVLDTRYDGQFTTLMERAGGHLFRPNGHGVIQQLVRDFPAAFGDRPFAKLPMVAVKTLWERRGVPVPTTPQFEALTRFVDLEHLEGAADYYIPFFLLRHGVIDVAPELMAALTRREYLQPESEPERELRAFTLVALRMLQRRTGIPMAELDSICWATGAISCRRCTVGVDPAEVPCAVRPGCLGFNREPERMAAGWPLVLTTRY